MKHAIAIAAIKPATNKLQALGISRAVSLQPVLKTTNNKTYNFCGAAAMLSTKAFFNDF